MPWPHYPDLQGFDTLPMKGADLANLGLPGVLDEYCQGWSFFDHGECVGSFGVITAPHASLATVSLKQGLTVPVSWHRWAVWLCHMFRENDISPVYALKDDSRTGAEKWLVALGFKPVSSMTKEQQEMSNGMELWQWQK